MDLDRRLDDLWYRPIERLPDEFDFPRGESAVLLLIVSDPEPGLVLTRRAARLRTDPGFVALPGGRCEPNETAAQAARRETCEEIGICEADITVRGRFDDAWSSAGFRVVPVVATTADTLDLRAASPDEVHEARIAPLRELADPTRRRRVVKEIDGHEYVDEVIDLDDDWEVYGLTADLVLDLTTWIEGSDRRRIEARRADLEHFASHRW